MRERGRGWILNLTSFAAELPPGPPFPTNKPATGGFQYGASKAALNRLTVAAASETHGQGVAVNVLQKMGLDLETVRLEVEKQVGTGQETKNQGSIPYTPRVKKVLALAGKEAKALSHSYVGTEHILLGLLREGEGVAARVLKSLDIDIERTRNEILRELDPQFSGGEEGAGAGVESDAVAEVALLRLEQAEGRAEH